MWKLPTAIVVLGSLLCTTTAGLAESNDRANCVNDGADPDLRIAACTSVINEKQMSRQDQSNAHYNRGNAWVAKGEHDKAVADYNRAISLDPRNAFAYNSRANAWAAKGEHDKAIAKFTKAISLDPNYAPAYYNRGNAWAARGEHDKAIADYNKAIALDPRNALAYNNRGIAWAARGEHDKAIADVNQAISLDPKDAFAYNNRGIVWGAKGDHDKAIADYTEAISLDPNYALAYSNRSKAWAAMGERDKAIADYTKATSLDSRYSSAYPELPAEGGAGAFVPDNQSVEREPSGSAAEATVDGQENARAESIEQGGRRQCSGHLRGGAVRAVAERAAAALAQSSQPLRSEFDLDAAFMQNVKQALQGVSTGKWADDIVLRNEVETALQNATAADLAACLPGYARAVEGIAKFNAEQAEEQRRREAEKQTVAEAEAREAQKPENLLQAAYQHYLIVRRCHEAREGYAVVYVSDQEMERSREAAKQIEAFVKDADPTIDTYRVWASATKSAQDYNPMLDLEAAFLMSHGGEGEYCKLAMRRLATVLKSVAPEAFVPEKDF